MHNSRANFEQLVGLKMSTNVKVLSGWCLSLSPPGAFFFILCTKLFNDGKFWKHSFIWSSTSNLQKSEILSIFKNTRERREKCAYILLHDLICKLRFSSSNALLIFVRYVSFKIRNWEIHTYIHTYKFDSHLRAFFLLPPITNMYFIRKCNFI